MKPIYLDMNKRSSNFRAVRVSHSGMSSIGENRGIVLPIALILLLVSTLVGVASLRNNSLSEKMTRNTIQREAAFSKAETALLEGEAIVDANAAVIKTAIEGQSSSNTCSAQITIAGSATRGFCSPATDPQGGGTASTTERWKQAGIWDSTASPKPYVTAADGETKYIIEFMGHIFGTGNVSSCPTPPTSWPFCPGDGYQFRITALAEGAVAGEAKVMLQSTYVVAP